MREIDVTITVTQVLLMLGAGIGFSGALTGITQYIQRHIDLDGYPRLAAVCVAVCTVVALPVGWVFGAYAGALLFLLGLTIATQIIGRRRFVRFFPVAFGALAAVPLFPFAAMLAGLPVDGGTPIMWLCGSVFAGVVGGMASAKNYDVAVELFGAAVEAIKRRLRGPR